MRRMLPSACAVALLASIVVVAVAHDGGLAGRQAGAPRPSRPAPVPASGPFAVAASRAGRDQALADANRRSAARASYAAHDRGRHGGVNGQLVADLAVRLGVDRAPLRLALETVRVKALRRAVERRAITAEQARAVEACLERLSCDHDVMRRAARDLRRDLTSDTWAARKGELLGDLAGALRLPVRDVDGAVRAEVAAKLATAASYRAISGRVRELALACYDAPDRCDAAALKRAARSHHGGAQR